MNTAKRLDRYLEIAKYLCIQTGVKESGRPIYKTLEEAGVKFGYASTHIARIKAKMIGPDNNGPRRVKDEYLSNPS